MLGRLYDTPAYNIQNNMGNITEMYTAYAVDFIHRHAPEPFFLFFTPDSTHGPTFNAPAFTNTSRRGPYGDSLDEVWQPALFALPPCVSLQLCARLCV